jgi:transposase
MSSSNTSGLLDNATVHHTSLVRSAMEVALEGFYLFVALYSPDLKQVGRLFAEVKDLLRHRENEAVLRPMEAIS